MADEQEDMVDRYLNRGDMYILEDDSVKGVCVVTCEGDGIYEIKNIAVAPDCRGRGYGRVMIDFVCDYYSRSGDVMYVGTGDSPMTLPFYEACGFETSYRIDNFFIDNYDEPIFEAGRQLKDMIILKKTLEGGEQVQNIRWIENRFRDTRDANEYTGVYSTIEMDKANRFHATMPGYTETPLKDLSGLAALLGVDKVYVKDESERFGLNAFKGLGVSYAMAKYFAGVLELDLDSVTFDELLERVSDLPEITFATATDGNHGKGVAWAAGIFNQKAKVYMPEGTAKSRLNAVTDHGAEGHITNMNYDDTVRYAAEAADENDWVLLQDTAWEGYEDVPENIMKGYMTIVSEIIKQLGNKGFDDITHIFLQAGVGSFAGAMAAAVFNATGGDMPEIIIAEPRKADCLYQSAGNENGEPVAVAGDLDSMMAGLCCGEPNPAAWNILKSLTNYFISCDDSVSAQGMRVLGNPSAKDHKVISGESGAVTTGVLHEVTRSGNHVELKKRLGLDETSKVLLINTEGDTDPDNYRKVVGAGASRKDQFK